MLERKLEFEEYAKTARNVAAEGCVLIKNDKNALPIKNNEKVAVFGRGAFYYYKSGLGSGGMVNTKYVVSILDALKQDKQIKVDEGLVKIYEDWIRENPVDEGHGWGTTPWSQKEMPVTDEMLQHASDNDAAIVIIARTAGEDQDNKNEEGSFLLTQIERDMLKKVTNTFERTIVLLNVGNIIDMSWVKEFDPSAIMYVWQGGQEGGNAVLDVLRGTVCPCGKLTDTIAKKIEAYPSTPYFGGKEKNYYKEDIYVGYRYFESCAKEAVLYPFGFGLSYTEFEISGQIQQVTEDSFFVSALVKNVGGCAGKEVVQVYVEAPQGKLGKPLRVLAGFQKTDVLLPGETQNLLIECPKSYFASYDDKGVTGHRSCMLLEAGAYNIFVGNNVRSAENCGSFEQKEQIFEKCHEACAPVEDFDRMVLTENTDGNYIIKMEEVPSSNDPAKQRDLTSVKEITYTGDRGFLLEDVRQNKITMDAFVAQLNDDELIDLFHGEGMCSLKVTPGTAGAFGGVTDGLQKYGIPAACCADGPSGIRMDCGTKAFSLPNGTAMGCSFNLELIEKLYVHVGKELRRNRVDTLLGPGINIHRHPLNGRNFEYISEDPILTGKVCTAELLGMGKEKVTGTVKHYCGNNQEQGRYMVESVIPERALREIYLKGFEMAVKEGKARSFMTTYGPVNGLWTAGSYDLCTTILRDEWGFKGIVMTDWWADANWFKEDSNKANHAPMVTAQNDIYMCCSDPIEARKQDNVKEALQNGKVSRAELQRNAKNILKFILESPAMLRKAGLLESEDISVEEDDDTDYSNMSFYEADKESGVLVIDGNELHTKAGDVNVFGIVIPQGQYEVTVRMSSQLGHLAQLPCTLYLDNMYRTTFHFNGTEGKTVEQKFVLGNTVGQNHYVKLMFGVNGIDLDKFIVSPISEDK